MTRRQLVAAGVSPSGIARRLRSGLLRRVHGGVYLLGPLAPPGAAEMAAVLASGPGVVVSHLSAASLWGLRPTAVACDAWHARRNGPTVDITVTAGKRGCCPGIRAHRVARIEADERTVRDGIPITSPGRTLLDLAGVLGTRELESAVARAEREGLVAREVLSALLLRHRGRPGTPALRTVLERQGTPALTRSNAEERFLALIRAAGLPPPETNVMVGPYEVDFLWRAAGIGAEVDGFRHHSSRPRFEGDRRRDSWLLAAGITIVRLSWRQIVQEATATAVQLGQALARAGSEHAGWTGEVHGQGGARRSPAPATSTADISTPPDRPPFAGRDFTPPRRVAAEPARRRRTDRP